MDFIKLSWQELEKDCTLLSKKITDAKINEIISISRGGMVVSRILSDLLSLPISHIAIESYIDLKQHKEPVITQISTREFKGETILLVDELSDSGKTLARGLRYVQELPIAKVYTAAPYYKSHTTHVPDFTVKRLDSWIIFPYEVRETKEAFIKKFGSVKKALEKMKEVGFEEWELQEVKQIG